MHASAQIGPDDYAVAVWAVEQGLPRNTISTNLQDGDGCLWLGTPGGLVRWRRGVVLRGMESLPVPHINVSIGRTGGMDAAIVGVVDDIKMGSLDEAEGLAVHLPHAQLHFGLMTLVVRTPLDPASLVPSVAAAVHEIDAWLPLADVRTMAAVVEATLAHPRVVTVLVSALGLVALPDSGRLEPARQSSGRTSRQLTRPWSTRQAPWSGPRRPRGHRSARRAASAARIWRDSSLVKKKRPT